MHNINIWSGNQLAEIMIPLHPFAALAEGFFQVVGVNIAYCQQTGVLIAEMAKPHPSHANNALGKLITRSQVTAAAQHMTRNNCQSSTGQRPSPDEFSSPV
ncbi:MAG: hypothetical protein BWY89_01831 [Bacteroidetes bacterium ADurb.BinA012]|nr:MAG: hypothetical protein BWY89_01831 [Bacteroidetes bacterium ADurb.BinA012]